MKTIKLALILSLISLGAFAQDFQVPNYKFESAKDYDTYEKDVINCVNWLANTPINEQTEKRKAANAFLLQWISGSPKVHIEIKPDIVTFLNEGELLMTFMGSWAKYSLESKDFNNKIEGSMKGVEAVIEVYQKNKGVLSKNKEVEKYIKMKEKGTLKEYIEKHA